MHRKRTTTVVAGSKRQHRPIRDPEDAELLTRVCKGDRAAFVTLYDRYAPLVRAIGYETTGRLSEAQDLTQEVFLRAWQTCGNLRHPEKFSAWLIGISRHVCLEWQRKQARDRIEFNNPQPIQAETAGNPGNPEEFNEIHHALQQLPESERLAVHLFYLEEQSAEYVRSLLHISRSGFYKLLARARHQLKKVLTEHQESKP